jgi:HSP20 family protein
MAKKKNKKIKKEELEDLELSESEDDAVLTDDEDDADTDELWDQVEEEIEEEGQLSVDVYQDEDNVIIKSTIAGVEPEDIDVSVDNDMVTIRGRRARNREIEEEDYFYQECYWGSFSRSIILPVEIRADQIDATIKNGILTVILPKAKKKDVNIKVKDKN